MQTRRRTPQLLLAGWMLVVGWIAATPGVSPLMFAAMAWIDGEHGVEVRGVGEALSVVLTHGTQEAGKAHGQIHQHRLFGRVLTCCAQSPRGEVDHVMIFSGTNVVSIERKAAVDSESGNDEVPPAPIHFVVVALPVAVVADEGRFLIDVPGGLPRISSQQHALLI